MGQMFTGQDNMKIYTTDTPVGKISVMDNDIFASQLKQLGQYAEQTVIDDYLKPYIENVKTILDIGGHVGYHTLGYKKINPESTIHIFEPQIQLFNLLNKNIKDNNITKVHTYNNAVGHINTKINLGDTITDGPNANRPYEYGSSDLYNLGGVSIGFGSTEVDMICLDSLALEDVGYIKVDVEGAESLVFLGAKDLIKKYKPVICFEHNHKKLNSDFVFSIFGSSLPSPFDVLKSLGYNKFIQIPYENIIATQ